MNLKDQLRKCKQNLTQIVLSIKFTKWFIYFSKQIKN